MNYFAHLVLAQPTVESTVGNLLGDFARGVDPSRLHPEVLAGLQNHRAVDRFTDGHAAISDIKRHFSPQRRRFAGIALDVYFDHLLMKYWDRFEARSLNQVIRLFYERMARGQRFMPGPEMRRVTSNISAHDWFGSYQQLDSVAESLNRIAARIRFANSFHNAIDDLNRIEPLISAVFLEFFPELKQHIESLALETSSKDLYD